MTHSVPYSVITRVGHGEAVGNQRHERRIAQHGGHEKDKDKHLQHGNVTPRIDDTNKDGINFATLGHRNQI